MGGRESPRLRTAVSELRIVGVKRCLIALGGNVGPVEETFATALAQFDAAAGVQVLRSSSVHRSAPVGGHAGGEFRNAAAEFETDLPPLELLDRLQAIESQFGRTRDIRWGPRTLDLDLILYGSEMIDQPRLRVPHPACWYRRFVLDPVVELAPDTIHPEKRATFAHLRDRLLPRPLQVEVAGGSSESRSTLILALREAFADIGCAEWRPGRPEPALLAWLGPDDFAPSFESLPVLPRLDASRAVPDQASFLCDVVQSAGGLRSA